MAVTGARNRSYAAERPTMTLAQKVTGAVGVVFLVVGILGFIPGVTTNVDDISFWGTDSGAHLFDLFHVSVFHNLVHVAYGVVGLMAMVAGHRSSRSYLLGGGAVYLLLWLYGLVVDQSSDANFVPLNDADNWLHLGLGIGMIALGLFLARDLVDRSSPTMGEPDRRRDAPGRV